MTNALDIRDILKKMPNTVRVGVQPGGLTEFLQPQTALVYVRLQTHTLASPWTIEIYPGTYDPVTTIPGDDYIHFKAVGSGADYSGWPTAVIIRGADATALTVNQSFVWFEGITFSVDAPSVARNVVYVTGLASVLHMKRCLITTTTPGAFAHHGIHADSTASGNVYLEDVSIRGIGANSIDLYVQDSTYFFCYNCKFNGGGIYGVYATGANDPQFYLFDCDIPHGVYSDTALSIIDIRGGQYRSVTISAGGIRADRLPGDAYAGSGIVTQTGGTFVVYSGGRNLEVCAGMRPQDAVNWAVAWGLPVPSAATPWTVRVHAGVYPALVMAAWVNVVCDSPESVAFQTAGVAVVTIAPNCLVDKAKISWSAAAAAIAILDAGVLCVNMMFRGCVFDFPATGAGWELTRFSGGSQVRFERCRYPGLGTGGGSRCINMRDVAGTINLVDCDFTSTSVNMPLVQLFVAGGLINIINTKLESPGGEIVCGAGVVRTWGGSYQNVIRAGTGVVIPDDPERHPGAFRIVRRSWEVAAIANMNITPRIAVGGAIALGGTGQARLRINDNALDAAGVEQSADAAGALASTWTPARGIQYTMPFSASAWRATTTAFFGVRGVLGAAVPGMAEHHAGFRLAGAALVASSSNGAGVGEATALALPSTGVHHVWKVIIVGGVRVEFYIDGILVATHATVAGVPTAVLYFQEYEISSGAGGATTSDITLREGFIEEAIA